MFNSKPSRIAMKNPMRVALFGMLAVGMFAAAPAFAGAHWSVNIGVPGPAYYAPPPVYYAPPPVYYAPPPPVYVRPPPVVVYGAPGYYPPAYYGRPGYYWRERGWHDHYWHDRGWRR
jgi:hypothetical protein